VNSKPPTTFGAGRVESPVARNYPFPRAFSSRRRMKRA
jgi:hypothetical protein